MKKRSLLLLLALILLSGGIYYFNHHPEAIPITDNEVLEGEDDGYETVDNDVAIDSSVSIAHQARSILVKPCGSCHQSSLPTQKAGALAVFDLDNMDDWYKEMTEEEYEGVEGRLGNREKFSEEQEEVMLAFIEFAKGENLEQ